MWYIVTALLLFFRLLGLACYTFRSIIHVFLHSSSVIWIMSFISIVGIAWLINRYATMLGNLFHISLIDQVLIPLIMDQFPANGELGMAILRADGERVPLTFRMEESGLAYVTAQPLQENAVRISTKSTVFCWFQEIWENNVKIEPLCH